MTKSNFPYSIAGLYASPNSDDASLRNISTKSTHRFVVDGGSLLHHLTWKKDSSYSNIIQCYKRFVTNTYGKCLVVFDGYTSGPSTKYMTHRRRDNKKHSLTVNFTEDMKFNGKKEIFLTNFENKERFFRLLGNELEC